jgi:hypothetical protein
MRHARHHAGVQDLLPLEDIVDGVLGLRGGDYRAVLEVQSINFALKSDSEQEGIIAGYKAFLNSLSYPLQVVVRILPTDVEAYLDGLRGRPRARGDETLRRLALDHESFVRRLARERSLLERRFYAVIPAGLEGAFEKRGMRWPWQAPPRDFHQNLDAAARQLAFRSQEIAMALATFGVTTRRLGSEELALLWGAFLRADVLLPPAQSTYRRPVITSRNGREPANYG